MENNIKKPEKVYLSDKDKSLLKAKAEQYNITGRGWLTHLFEMIANKPVIIVLKGECKLILEE